MHSLKVNFDQPLGRIRAMHAVGQPPFYGMDFSYCRYLEAAHVPYARLHDVGGAYGRSVFVDIPNLFRNFDADENDPASYDFAFTDVLLSELHKKVKRYRKISVSNPQRALMAVKEHREIFDAISAHNANLAEKLTSKHISNARESIIKSANI